MPHINRIRVNNVKYNFATQYYDDFVMRFSCKNTIYDLANGGGKSVLMLLLLQNLIPNCTLDEKQPIEKLFRPGNDNQTIHSLIEWKLNASDVKNGFQYMTTGFCARKAKETDTEELSRETASVEYFNYCILYREFNANDIVNLPLSNGRERITYQGLKNYLRDLDKKDYSLQIHIFERKGDYQRFISNFGLYESEWEIIRGINKTEGHVRTYFENHYRTTRKVVEDLFIEEIIEKSFHNRMESQGENQIAQTLLDIREKLMELSKKKSDIQHFDKQMEVLDEFSKRLTTLNSVYTRKEELEENLVKTYQTAKLRIQQKQDKLKFMGEQAEGMKQQQHEAMGDMERAKLQKEETYLTALEQEVNSLKKEVEIQETSCKEQEELLKKTEAANSYLDYLDNKQQLKIHQTTLNERMNHNENILTELYTLAFNQKHHIVKQKKELSQEKENRAKQSIDIQNQIETVSAKRLQAERESAIIESQEQELQRIKQTSQVSLEKLCHDTGILMASQMKPELSENTRKQLECKTSLEECQNGLNQVLEQLSALDMVKSEEQINIRQTELRLQDVKEFLMQYEQQSERLHKMQEIYEETQIDILLEKLEHAYRNQIEKAHFLTVELQKCKEYQKSCETDAPLVQSEVTDKLVNFIKRHYDEQAETGLAYIAKLSNKERQEVLERIPILPYAIIVGSHFHDISVDENIRKMNLDGRAVPIMERTLLTDFDIPYDNNKLGFALKDNEVFYNEELLQKNILNCKEEIQNYEDQLSKVIESEDIIHEDIDFISGYSEYMEKKAPIQIKRHEELLVQLKDLLKQQEERSDQENALKERQSALTKQAEQLQNNLKTLTDEQENLNKVAELFDTLVKTDLDLKEHMQKKSQLQTGIAQYESQLKVCKDSLEENQQILNNINKNLLHLEERWKPFIPYDKQEQSELLAMEMDEIETQFLGKKQAFEQKNADISDKQKLVESYESAVKKSEQDLQYRGIGLSQMQNLYAQNRLVRTDIKQLLEDRKKLEQDRKALENLTHELTNKQFNLNRQQGSIEHGVKLFEAEYGTYEKTSIDDSQLQQYLAKCEKHVQDIEQQIKMQIKEQKEIEQDCYTLEAMMSEIRHMMESFGISSEHYSGSLDYGISLKETYQSIRKAYESIVREEQRKREEFEKDKARLIETLKLLEAFDLADEIERSIQNPKDKNEVAVYIENIDKTRQCIQLEKERIEKGIENMEVIKDNFENQCIQTCSSIKTALERLPGLSVIQLDDKPVSMIQLQIPYLKEEHYKEAMSAYIDRVVEGADSLPTANEKIRYIRTQLAWKKLFSVIVKDMDRIKLQLYKRERMKEQSRYLKYEEAVGSTGQSQGIYIQFLVAVINYISSMNSHNTDGGLLKKVIFIDNPFGAAKDTYIWEPIFKLLKSNNVQLIVPARGATPAITGRFEVNYILGQKLMDHRQQTVVVDYRSQVQEDVLEYRELEFEQTNLFNDI